MSPSAPLTADTLQVRWLETGRRPDWQLAGWRDLLDDEERARADRHRQSNDRETFIAAHALLRSMLSDATGVPSGDWRFTRDPYGKPALAPEHGGCGLRFNLAHTRGMAVCALAREEIGVDVEATDRRVDLAIANRFFAPREVEAIATAPPAYRPELFFRFWTLKEAFIKATGEGLSRNLASFSFGLDPVQISFHPVDGSVPSIDDPNDWQFMELRPRDDRPIAVAVRRPAALPIRLDAGDSSGQFG
jgi:4'-phosphopantetheinyl transferase